MKLSIPCVLGCLAVLAISPAVQAAWLTIDDFQSYAPGSQVAGSNGWVSLASDSPQFLAVADPTNAANQALQVTTIDGVGQSVAYNNSASFAISDGTSPVTVYGRVMLPTMTAGLLDACVFGVSSSASSPHFSNTLKAYAAVDKSTLEVRSGTAFPFTFVPAKDTWYSLWFVLNNVASGDNYDVYIQGGVYTTQTQVGSGFLFRGGDTALLQTFVVETDGDVSPDAGVFYLDDLNVDTAGQNLANPTLVPEPATLGLLAVGGIVTLLRRRR